MYFPSCFLSLLLNLSCPTYTFQTYPWPSVHLHAFSHPVLPSDSPVCSTIIPVTIATVAAWIRGTAAVTSN